MNNKERKAKIVAAIKKATKEGFTLVYGDWGNTDMKCACALGCLFIADGVNPQAENQTEEDMAERILNVDTRWITSFVDGFDGNGVAGGSHVPEAWTMGNEIRNEMNPTDFAVFVDNMDE